MRIRKFLIAGNWKMNKTSAEAAAFASDILLELGQQLHDVDTLICPPFTALESAAKAVEGSTLKLGGQNMHHEAHGAFTGEVSAEMLRHLYVTYVILGHSERRTLFGETDEFVNKKVGAAVTSRLRPILCIGETLEEREAEKTFEVVERQLAGGLKDIKIDTGDQIVIAYEPVWAIGTGKTATPEQAQEAHAFIRKKLGEILGDEAARRVRILYGGSMKPANAKELLSQPDIDGGLIGGASLEARGFCQMVKTAVDLSQ